MTPAIPHPSTQEYSSLQKSNINCQNLVISVLAICCTNMISAPWRNWLIGSIAFPPMDLTAFKALDDNTSR